MPQEKNPSSGAPPNGQQGGQSDAPKGEQSGSPQGGPSFSRVAECFLAFGVDPAKNISKLTELCGELLKADCTIYDRMDGAKMTRLGGWNLPQDNAKFGFGRDSTGYDSVKMFLGEIFEIHHYDKAPASAGSADNPITHSYLGRVVKDNGIPVGALSALFYNKRALSTEDREILGIIASAIVIEDKRLRAEETLQQQQLNIVATAKMSALGEMAAGVAHEVNNPLLAMLMRIEQLRDILVEAKSSPETISIVDALVTLTMRIAKIVKSLRSFSGDTQDEPFRPTTVSEIVLSAVEFCGQRFKQHEIELQSEDSLNGVEIQCRPTELSRVILNLLQNSFDAIEFSKGQKWVNISAKQIGSGNSRMIEIYVADSGKGIGPEIREQIFLPFFSTKDVNRGKGLGLSVARGIVEKHKGTIKLDTASENTRFIIRLPAVQPNVQKE